MRGRSDVRVIFSPHTVEPQFLRDMASMVWAAQYGVAQAIWAAQFQVGRAMLSAQLTVLDAVCRATASPY